MVVTWWIVFFCAVDRIAFPEIFIHITVQPVNENCSKPRCSLLMQGGFLIWMNCSENAHWLWEQHNNNNPGNAMA